LNGFPRFIGKPALKALGLTEEAVDKLLRG
jgi:hypothetical protein